MTRPGMYPPGWYDIWDEPVGDKSIRSYMPIVTQAEYERATESATEKHLKETMPKTYVVSPQLAEVGNRIVQNESANRKYLKDNIPMGRRLISDNTPTVPYKPAAIEDWQDGWLYPKTATTDEAPAAPEPKPETEAERRLTLSLTDSEAATLYVVAGCIGGDPDGPRGSMDSIRQKLANADPSRQVIGKRLTFADATGGGIFFPDSWPGERRFRLSSPRTRNG